LKSFGLVAVHVKGDPGLLSGMQVEVRAKLNLQRANGAFLTIHPPGLEGAHRSLVLGTVVLEYPD
jgi:hypothetical protein